MRFAWFVYMEAFHAFIHSSVPSIDLFYFFIKSPIHFLSFLFVHYSFIHPFMHFFIYINRDDDRRRGPDMYNRGPSFYFGPNIWDFFYYRPYGYYYIKDSDDGR